MQTSGKEVDVSGVSRGFDEKQPEIAHVAELVAFAEAVVSRDEQRIAETRARLQPKLGEAAFVDACATVAAFHGFVRIADAIGIPYTTAAAGRDAPEIREQAGVNRFHRVQEDQARAR